MKKPIEFNTVREYVIAKLNQNSDKCLLAMSYIDGEVFYCAPEFGLAFYSYLGKLKESYKKNNEEFPFVLDYAYSTISKYIKKSEEELCFCDISGEFCSCISKALYYVGQGLVISKPYFYDDDNCPFSVECMTLSSKFLKDDLKEALLDILEEKYNKSGRRAIEEDGLYSYHSEYFAEVLEV